MTNNTTKRDLRDLALIVDPEQDHVAVAKQFIPADTPVIWEQVEIVVKADVPAGHRFAVQPVVDGAWVRQYGRPFARSKGLSPGDPVNEMTVESDVPEVGPDGVALRTPKLPPWEGKLPSFQGFHREDGHVGTRNWVLVVPTSMCSSHEASQIAVRSYVGRDGASDLYSRERYPNVDGVTAIPHDGGCGCPYGKPGATVPGAYEATLRILAQHIQHPNVGAAILIELGCEKTNLAAFDAYFGTSDLSGLYGKPVRRLTIQELGGTRATIEKGLELIPELLGAANETARAAAPMSALALGLECGGSDAFSGITANPSLGYASDLLVRTGGRSIIGEVPEFFGAAHLFAARAVNHRVADDVYALLENYREYAARSGHSMTENPSPGNRAGGLLNITIKSLGAMAKSGQGPVQSALQYGEWVWDWEGAGVYLLNTPGYDQLSVPGIVGAGSQVVCFTTGRGTGIGNAIAPVIKISSNTALYERMGDDMDVNAGVILDSGVELSEVGRRIFSEIRDVASGKQVRAEVNGHREFALWNVEGLWL
ncbi:MAG: UxaA family hydrolase [Anaerolineae bacterium]